MNQFLLLLALCVFDFLVIVTVILLKGIPTIEENHSLKLLLPVVHPLMNLTWIMSIYLTVLLAIERFMVICWTNLKTKHYTKKRTKVYLLFTFVFVGIYNIPKCMEYTLWCRITVLHAYWFLRFFPYQHGLFGPTRLLKFR